MTPCLCDLCGERYAGVYLPQDALYLCVPCYRWLSETRYRHLLDQEYARQAEWTRRKAEQS